MERSQFTFYASFLESIEKLGTNKEKLQAYEAIVRYGLRQESPDETLTKPTVLSLFAMIRPILSSAHTRAENYRKQQNSRAANAHYFAQE